MADLSELRAIPAARARLDAAELALIDQARRDGATWADIAGALGLTSRQAAEQRRLRLATAALRVPAGLDAGYGERIAALRAAAVDLHRRIGADRRWDRRFTRAALVRETLAAAHDAPAGSLFELVTAVVSDLGWVSPAEPAAGVPRPRARSSEPVSSLPSPPAATPSGPAPPADRRARPTPPADRRAWPALPGPTRAAVDRLRSALAAAFPQP